MGFSDLGKKLSKIGQDTKNGVQKVSDSVSISNRITAEKKSLERLYASIGEAVYKESPDVAKEGLEDEWAAVKVAYANIASLNDQLNHVKGIIYCPNCGRPAARGDKFCAKCGFRLDNLQETTGSKVAQDIREAGQEVGKLAGNAADKTGELVGGAAADTKNFFSRLKDSAVCRLKGGRTVIIPKKKLNWKWHIYNSGKAYRDVQIEEWVNSHDITGKTKYLFCVSRYNQHGWIMEGKKGAWKCRYVFKLSTIAYGPQEYGWNHCEISQHYIGKKNVGGGISISYASKAGGNQIHIGKGGHPATHGCIGMSKKSLNFVYYYLPIGTRVLTI